MAQDFFPFVENGDTPKDVTTVLHPARIAVYDDAAAAPRVVVVEPKDVRGYLEEITLQVTQLAQGQGGSIPFMVIREIVENFIHAYFMEPTISILDHGNTIRFSDQGPGIREKDRALQYGTTSATEEMRRYIRGVGSGLPYVQQYMTDKGGSLEIDDNMSGGTVVTLYARSVEAAAADVPAPPAPAYQQIPYQQAPYQQQYAQPQFQQQQYAQPQYVPPQHQQQFQQPAMPYQHPAYPQPQFQQQTVPYAQPPQPQTMQAAPSWPAITVRGRAILDFLMTHDSVGPSDLARAYGESQPTWTRELQALEEQGLIRKDGQKRRLTAMGQSFISA